MAVTLSEVTKLYVATFNRAPDAAGITYWANSGMPIENIAQSFFDQPETQSLYPSGTANSSFVTSVYDNLFNRAPDTDGLNYWVQELDSGSVSKQNFILAVINGAQNTAISQDATILTNKQTVGLDFVAKGLESVDLAQYVMEDIDASTTSVQDAIALIQTIVAPTQQFTAEMVNNLELYRYDEADSENYTTGYDAYLKATFHTDGTATIEKYKAPLGSSTWEMYASYNKSWQLVNNQLVVSGDDNAGDISQTTFTLLSQTQTEWSFLDETIGTDTMGTPETSDDVPYTDAPNISVWLTQEPLIPRSTITIEETTYLQGGFYTQGEGVSANGGVDYDVNVTATAANVSTMLGDLVNTAFIINIHDTTANQAITGTTKNDVFNWRGGNDSFDGSSDGGDWYNGGSDAVSRTVSSPTSTVTFDTSWLNTLRIITGTSTVATILKNNDGSFDISSGSDSLHLTHTELFRLYVSTETGGEVFNAFNVDIDLTGVQTGDFDAVFI